MYMMSRVEKGGRVCSLPEYSEGDSGAVEVHREGNGAVVEAEEESRRKWKKGRSIEVCAHSQILRIRAEDSHLGKDIGEGNLSLRDKYGELMVFSRNILPASPLSGKTAY